jgi:alpha-tubulin suppressor-like RCC1 family protein
MRHQRQQPVLLLGLERVRRAGHRHTSGPRLWPVLVATTLWFRQVDSANCAAGERHTCGVTTGDEVLCWGANRWGQLGFESSRLARFPVPTRVSGTQRYANLTAGAFHTCAVTVGSKAFCRGNGRAGQIGDGKTFLRFTPRAVAGGSRSGG